MLIWTEYQETTSKSWPQCLILDDDNDDNDASVSTMYDMTLIYLSRM